MRLSYLSPKNALRVMYAVMLDSSNAFKKSIAETLLGSKDTPIIFTDGAAVEEFLIDSGLAHHFKPRQEGQNRDVQFLAWANHPTHYLLVMRTRDYVNPQENGYTLICTPKSTQTLEQFKESCQTIVKAAEETLRKVWGSSQRPGDPVN